ncbi:hypothetical protein Nstercoris_00156 [Nitrosomonas stercoris]|uniref:Uncharacterized protein n=1 Tax=Nitrosomonas stercoris TaxID=1444684 RepID=A0A4Y1YJL4_9PROT|nr:hypothetical protein Nstercoris_00156 [Nitrosomonas stercoris]
MATPVSQKQPQTDGYNNTKLSIFKCVKDKAPAGQINWNDLCELAEAPSIGRKEDARAITPHDGAGKTKTAAEAAKFYAVVIDYGNGVKLFDDELTYWQQQNLAAVMFTTSSHTPEAHKFKAIIPLAEPVRASDWVQLAQGLAIMRDGDPAQARAAQVFFAPNKLASGSDYKYAVLSGDPISRSGGVGAQAIARAQELVLSNATVKAHNTDARAGGIINLINEKYSVYDLIEESGHYKHAKDRYLHRGSTSGVPGVAILERDGRRVVYSFHGDSDPLSSSNHNGHALDAADVMCALRYNGDLRRMIREQSAELDPEGNKRRQREYMQTPHTERLKARAFNEIISDAKKLTKSSAPSEIDQVAKDVYELKAIERRTVLNVIKARTGLPLSVLTKAGVEDRPQKGGA